MNKLKCKIAIDNKILDYEVEGEVFTGGDNVMLDEDDNLISTTPWSREGYTVQPFLSPVECSDLKEGLSRLIAETVREIIPGKSSKKTFRLAEYHKFVTSDKEHAEVIERTRKGWEADALPIALSKIEERIGKILGFPVTARNPSLGKTYFYIRIIRPNEARDFNPPHRDVWLDRLRNAVNIYFPLSASNKLSSLPLVPSSHLWKESQIMRTREGAAVNGLKFTVPSVISAEPPLTMKRPDPKETEVLLFSPYLIHGGGINFNKDLTRSSLEMRFWRRS